MVVEAEDDEDDEVDRDDGDEDVEPEKLVVARRLAPAITPEMAAAVSKMMRNQDLILAAKKCRW